MRIVENNVCKCGHIKKDHGYYGCQPCYDWLLLHGVSDYSSCGIYKQDNLKYLEQLYEERSKF